LEQIADFVPVICRLHGIAAEQPDAHPTRQKSTRRFTRKFAVNLISAMVIRQTAWKTISMTDVKSAKQSLKNMDKNT